MRLLHTTRMELQEFFDNEIPMYAILSHRWGEAEVNLQDLIAIRQLEDPRYAPWAEFLKLSMKTTKASLGYIKITKCCERAASDGYDWVWIDTCCIDKTSSAELSEAINSMYRWYEDAELCYAYLSDVKVDIASELSQATTELEESAHKSGYEMFCQMQLHRQKSSYYQARPAKFIRFRQAEKRWKLCFNATTALAGQIEHSKWFTRGWTLQELLAPKQVLFLNHQWKSFGTRSGLAKMLEAVTGIPESSLRKHRVAVSVAQKLCWASKRSTSRVEDTAYCLIGLFGVNMPLLYGEGQRAFRRLQEEILRTSEDETIFAWRAKEELDSIFGTGLHSGLLANSTAAFQNCGSIFKSRQFKRNPSIIVNQLLQMNVHCLELPLKLQVQLKERFDPDKKFILVPLRCASPEGSLALVLELSESFGEYELVYTHTWCVSLADYGFEPGYFSDAANLNKTMRTTSQVYIEL